MAREVYYISLAVFLHTRIISLFARGYCYPAFHHPMILIQAMFSFTETSKTEVKIGGVADIAMEIVLAYHALTVIASKTVAPDFEMVFQFCPTI